MAISPDWKVYNPQGQYVAACKHPEDAAAIVALYGNGTKIKLGHIVTVWHEGHETQPAGESFDFVASTCLARRRQHYEKLGIRHY